MLQNGVGCRTTVSMRGSGIVLMPRAQPQRPRAEVLPVTPEVLPGAVAPVVPAVGPGSIAPRAGIAPAAVSPGAVAPSGVAPAAVVPSSVAPAGADAAAADVHPLREECFFVGVDQQRSGDVR